MELPLFSYFPALPSPVESPLVESELHACPYLPDRQARTRALWADRLAPVVYQHLMDRAFRRSGNVIYQPICPRCRSCEPIRIRVDSFQPSRSQRRCWRRNADLQINCDAPAASDEKFELYERYVKLRHSAPGPESGLAELGPGEARAAFESFLYCSPTQTLEFTYRDPQTNRLLAVGLVDDCAPTSWSSVYFYFEPGEAWRGLGTFGILKEIAAALRNKVRYYYLGYWVRGARTMNYKAEFQPYELLDGAGQWKLHAAR